MSATKTWAPLLAVCLPLYLLDQATKWLVFMNIPAYGFSIEVVTGFFSIVHWANTGAAFSLGKGNNTGFALLAAVVLILVLLGYWRGYFADRLSRIGVLLLIPGIAGNLTDRLIHGYVVDFLLFDLHIPFANPWPAFNVADSCICVAAALFLFGSFGFGAVKAGPDNAS
jgi:signal peptidase II